MVTTITTKSTAITLHWDQLTAFLESHLSHPVRVLQVEEYEGTGHYRDWLATAGQPHPLLATYLVGGDVREAVVYPLNRPKIDATLIMVMVEPQLDELLAKTDLLYYLDNDLIHASNMPAHKLAWADG